MMMGGGVAPVGGETEPASGTVILGSSSATNYTEDWVYPSVYEEIFNHTPVTAAWSESASSTTVASLSTLIKGHFGGNCKMILRDSSLTNATISNVVVLDFEESASVKTFTFSSPPTVTKGSDYYVTLICDTDGAGTLKALATGSELSYSTNGSYATPATTATETTTLYAEVLLYGTH